MELHFCPHCLQMTNHKSSKVDNAWYCLKCGMAHYPNKVSLSVNDTNTTSKESLAGEEEK